MPPCSAPILPTAMALTCSPPSCGFVVRVSNAQQRRDAPRVLVEALRGSQHVFGGRERGPRPANRLRRQILPLPDFASDAERVQRAERAGGKASDAGESDRAGRELLHGAARNGHGGSGSGIPHQRMARQGHGRAESPADDSGRRQDVQRGRSGQGDVQPAL